MKNKISIVISVFNEEEGIYSFGNNLMQALREMHDTNFELIWVNDGSTDKSHQLIQKIIDNYKSNNLSHFSIEFSRNFGHESAMIAGIDNATGDAIICMDADGQHPAIEIPKMISSFLDGNDYVLMKRTKRNDNGIVKRVLSSMFYKMINALSEIKFQQNSSDYFLISKNIASILKTSYREKNRFLRGFIQSLGFYSTSISFIAPEREYGTSHYSYKNLFRLALSAIFTFSFKPLRISIYFSILFILVTIIIAFYSLFQYIYGNNPPSGYTTIILFMSFSFASLFFVLSILLLYLEKMIEETQQRPLYIIKRKKLHI